MSPTSVRTSRSHPIRVDWLDPPVRLGMTLGPGIHDESREGFRWERDLDGDLSELRRAGATALVCLLEDHELARYRIEQLLPRARAHGLEVLRLPIPDVDVPATFEAVDELLDTMAAHEAGGGRLVVHCRGGLGRTGTIAGCHLLRHGVSVAEALAMLVRVRQTTRCPETEAQRTFVARYATHLARRAGWPNTVLGKLGFREPRLGDGKHRELGTLLDGIEREVAAAPERHFTFAPTGEATLKAAGRTYAAGTFSTPTVGELRSRVESRAPGRAGRVIVTVLEGTEPWTDIGSLQASAPSRSLFQVASQFNCLEAPAARQVPVRDYLHDPTQGPRASISAFPGTFLRHYLAPRPDGTRFTQTDGQGLDLLGDVVTPDLGEVRSGYLETRRIRDVTALAGALDARFPSIRVGVHAGVEVVFGHDWSGPAPVPPCHIDQVFTSTIALGGYSSGGDGPALTRVCQQLLRASYLGTLLAAIDLGDQTIVLTLIGGGVFGNSLRTIVEAIQWAIHEVEPLVQGTLRMVVNARTPLPHRLQAR